MFLANTTKKRRPGRSSVYFWRISNLFERNAGVSGPAHGGKASLGAVVFGGVEKETVLLNEESFRFGRKQNRRPWDTSGGCVRGLRLPGRLKVDLRWKDGA